MRCLYPRTVGFQADGKTIAWTNKKYSPEYPSFQLPCSRCIECRLEYSRQWAVRCVHEAKMHEDNSFITLTYDDNHLKSDRLIYSDFQLFMKKLRKTQNEPIGMFVTGEYGERKKRPHWHAIIFNWRPRDCEYKYTSDRGDTVFTSATLTNLWGNGNAELGSVTFESAGYCARYAAKKLVHGEDVEKYQPISKKSSKNAIGKKFLEKYWTDIFNYGYVILDNGTKSSIPRYYEKWLKENQYEAWKRYISDIKYPRIEAATLRSIAEQDKYNKITYERGFRLPGITRAQARKKIIDQKFEQLQKHLKGDI